MARRHITSLVADRKDVVALLQSRGIMPKRPSAGMLDTTRKIHEATFSLILWKFRIGKQPDHKGVFLEEIASDALQVLPQVMMGYGKPAKLLARGIIENTLRHVYFSDHPVEFRRMNREAKWYLSFQELLDYAHHHHDFIETEPYFNALGRIAGIYGELSAGVHGGAVRDLEMRRSLKAIVFNDAAAATDANYIVRCAEAANFVLAIYHNDAFRGFQPEDRKIILRTMPAIAKRTIQQHH